MSSNGKLIVYIWIFFMVVMVLSNLPHNHIRDDPFPKPDSNRVAWGWDFKKGEYRYESHMKALPAKAVKTETHYPRYNTGISITKLSDIKDLDDLNGYIKSRETHVNIIHMDYTEDDILDYKDYMGD